MSTVFGGLRQLDAFQAVVDSTGDTNPTYTYYQVPAGRIAYVTIHLAKFGDGITSNGTKLMIGDIPFNLTGPTLNDSIYQDDAAGKLEYFNSTGDSLVGGSEYGLMRGEVKRLMTAGQTMRKTTTSGGTNNGIKVWFTVEEYAAP